MESFISTFVKIFFIMTPFFVLSVFLTVTSHASLSQKRSLAIKVTISIIISSLILLFFGKYIFQIFGITLDAFRIGAGALLFLTAVELVRGSKEGQKIEDKNLSELAVVPLAIPVTVGPGVIGILLVMGAEIQSFPLLMMDATAIVCSVCLIGVMLYTSTHIEKILGKQGLLIVSKITGIFVAAISAQIIFAGIKSFLEL